MPAGPTGAGLENLLGTAISAAARAKDTLTEKERKQQDRSLIARRVVWIYMVVVVAIILFAIATNFLVVPCAVDFSTVTDPTQQKLAKQALAGVCGDWQETGKYMLDITTTAVLPIVTLVLGYYFGTETKEP
jgi:ABC-type maltose transport system permease subunit